MDNTARQNVSAAVEDISLADVVSGTAFNLFSMLPNGVIPLALSVLIVTPFDSGTSDVLDIGLAGANEYLNDGDISAAAGTRIAATALPGLVDDTDGGIQLTGKWTAVGTAATEGRILVLLTYIELDREHYSQG